MGILHIFPTKFRGSSFLFVVPVTSTLQKFRIQILFQRFLGSFLGHLPHPHLPPAPPQSVLMPARNLWANGFQTLVCLRITKKVYSKCSILRRAYHRFLMYRQGLRNSLFFFLISNTGDSNVWLRNIFADVSRWNWENPDTGAWSPWAQNFFYHGLQYFSPQGQNRQVSNV